jgi:hypothetical protein
MKGWVTADLMVRRLWGFQKRKNPDAADTTIVLDHDMAGP